MWSRVLAILPILLAFPCYGTRSNLQTKKINQPELDDLQQFQQLATDSPESNDDPSNVFQELATDSPEDSEDPSDRPPLDNYLKLREKNADMVRQVERLAAETHELKHRLKMAKAQEKTAIMKIMKKCPSSHQNLPVEIHHQELKMPWSLAHTATRHQQKKGQWFPGEDTIRGFFHHLKDLSSSIRAESRSYASAGTQGQYHKDMHELRREMKQTHVRLGQSAELKSNLEAHLQAIKEKVVAMEEEANKDQQKLDDFAAQEQRLDQQLAATHSDSQPPADQGMRGDLQVSAEDEAQKEEKVKMESAKLHQEADRRLQESKEQIAKLKDQNDKLNDAIAASKARQPAEQTKLLNVQNANQQSNTTAEQLRQKEDQMRQEEADAKQKEQAEDNALMESAGKDERCAQWTSQLESKLKHVLKLKKDDASLCHNSILGLHKERINLKDGNAKMHTELKHLKQHAQEMQRQGDETLATLNSCLGR